MGVNSAQRIYNSTADTGKCFLNIDQDHFPFSSDIIDAAKGKFLTYNSFLGNTKNSIQFHSKILKFLCIYA